MNNTSKFDADTAEGIVDTSGDKLPRGNKDGASDGKTPTPSPETRKFAGAGPAIAEHSKDAKAVKGGRQPGAYVKDK